MAEKGGLGQFTDLRGGLGEKEEMVFLRGGGGEGGQGLICLCIP